MKVCYTKIVNKKILVTHINPHLDDITAVWLFKRFVPEFQEAEIKFIAQNEPAPENSSDIICLGVGKGKFDEHRGLPDESSTSLVWKWIKKNNYAPKDELAIAALDELSEHIRQEDTGHLVFRTFDLSSIISGLNVLHRNSLKTSEYIFPMLDGLLNSLKSNVQLKKDWEKRIEFETKWGKGVALKTKFSAASFAYNQGFVIVATINPSTNWHTIKANANSSVDLTPIYEKLKKIDPEAYWYFHQSKKMLINGADVAPNVKTSKLTLEEIIELLKIGN